MAGNRPHRFRVRVYYEDTDAAGIVYYANYLKFAERARTEMLRELGLDHRTLLERLGGQFAVRRCVADYRRPARLDDELLVETEVGSATAARIVLHQRILRGSLTLVELQVVLVFLDANLRPMRLPDALRPGLGGARPERS